MEGTFSEEEADKENIGGNNEIITDIRNVVSQLRIRGICESDLEARLQRLIRRQKFEEAEEFAKKYRFKPEEVRQKYSPNYRTLL